MPDSSQRPAVDPVTFANSTELGQKLAAARGGEGQGLGGMSKKELRKLVKAKDGVAMMSQAPRLSSETIGTLEHLLRMVPTTRRQHAPALHEGDAFPEFSVQGSHGETVSLESLRGRPFAMRLTRAMATTVI